MPSILFSSDLDSQALWKSTISALRPDVSVVDWRDAGDPLEFEFALLWKPPPGGLGAYRNLRAIQALAAGVDQLDLASLPDVPLARLTDRSLADSMTDYAVSAAYRYFRKLDRYERDSRAGRWAYEKAITRADLPVGIMGLGAIGAVTAQTFAQLGFPVRGWSRSPRTIDGVESFSGSEGLKPFLEGTQVLVNVLPLTPETEGILDAKLLGLLPRGAFLVNMGRGRHVVEADLVRLLDSGHIAGATLDVLYHEPPPENHPLLRREDVLITPHCAGGIDPRVAAAQVLENLDRALQGRPLLNPVDRTRGY